MKLLGSIIVSVALVMGACGKKQETPAPAPEPAPETTPAPATEPAAEADAVQAPEPAAEADAAQAAEPAAEADTQAPAAEADAQAPAAEADAEAAAVAADVEAAPPVVSTVKTEEVSYEADGVTMKGFLAWDGAKEGPRPGVLVVHEWWGHNAYARRRAIMLAELGYTALAVDMYGDGKTAEHPADAMKFAGEVNANLDAAKVRFEAAKKLLAERAETDPAKLAAVGYCFGGGIVLGMARMGEDLKGVVSVHGTLAAKTPAEKGAVKAEILVLTGAADTFVPADQVSAFEAEMKAAEAKFEVVSYEGAMHAFSNPEATELGKKFELPIAYDAKADAASWDAMKAFLTRVFGG